jgi:hypothetical protein
MRLFVTILFIFIIACSVVVGAYNLPAIKQQYQIKIVKYALIGFAGASLTGLFVFLLTNAL